MKSIIINGLWPFQQDRITGIERCSKELLFHLDEVLESSKLKVYYLYCLDSPIRIIDPNKFKNIIAVPIERKNRFMDRTRSLRSFAKKHKGIICNLSFQLTYLFNQIFFIYDIRALETDFDNESFRKETRKNIRKMRPFMGRICTDSNYQKERISKKLHFPKRKIAVFYMGYEHIKSIKSDQSIFKKHPILLEKPFYYSVGSVAKHKNYEWIINIAKNNPQSIFAIAGNVDEKLSQDYNIDSNQLKNVIYLGYVGDEESKALMEKCAGFLHPSKYEGFGIPPLEALSCGAKIAISNATCLPEVYEDCALYFDPNDYNINIEELFKKEVASPEKILSKCSWKTSALKFLQYLEGITGK